MTGVGHDVTIAGVTVRDGSGVTDGAGIYNNEANLSLREVVIADNHASADGEPGQFGGIANGGGIRSIGGSLRIVDSAIRGNVVELGRRGRQIRRDHRGRRPREREPADDPGIDVHREHGRRPRRPGNRESRTVRRQCDGSRHLDRCLTRTPRSSNSTIAGNLADASGGPGGAEGLPDGGGILIIANAGTEASLTGLTIAANEARGLGDPKGSERIKGGGLYFDGGAGAGLAVTATTLAANSVTGSESEGGNLFWRGGAPPTFQDTIISGGVGPAGSENCVSEVDSFGFNLESRDQCGFDAGGDLINTDPQLGPLGDNGGRTATMALATTSPAVDRGAAFGLATDQRGLPRPFDFASVPNSIAAGADGSDIGAFELQPPPAPARIHDLILGKLQRNGKRGRRR